MSDHPPVEPFDHPPSVFALCCDADHAAEREEYGEEAPPCAGVVARGVDFGDGEAFTVVRRLGPDGYRVSLHDSAERARRFYGFVADVRLVRPDPDA